MNTSINRTVVISLVILLAVAGIIVFIKNGAPLSGNSNIATKTNTNSNLPKSPIQFVSSKSGSGKSTFESTMYKFTITVDDHFMFGNGLATGYDLQEAYFSKPNPNMSDKKNRDTPNGFNTAVDDSIHLQVFKNRDGLYGNDIAAFRHWLPVHSVSVEGATIAQTKISGLDVIKTIEPDGIDSLGQYYYFFGPEYIYAFGTDDFSDAQMHEFLSGFSIQK